jgi:hypothetical protein
MVNFIVCLYAFFAFGLNASNELAQVRRICEKAKEPNLYLNKTGSLMTLGNASLDTANIIFLPEVHDDPESLLIQLLLIAREDNRGKAFIILDESLPSMQKSMWDVFSQKSLEIVAAQRMRQTKEKYIPRHFELSLKDLVTSIQKQPGQLILLRGSGLWALSDFEDRATPFFGWDLSNKASLLERNIHMTVSLKRALRSNHRIFIMAGARHIPELEFLTSQKLLCKADQFKDERSYFLALEKKFGERPELPFGIGATLPIYKFLSDQRYVIVFKPNLYEELNRVTNQMRTRNRRSHCITL